jgi:XTP/dITP diphosphohydrolase
MKVLVATRNPGKMKEYAELLGDGAPGGEAVKWVSLADLGIEDEVEETGSTFEENARLKAVAYATASGLLTLADDSGLEVEALDGAPGVYSARYAGRGAGDLDRIRKLLAALEGVPAQDRAARFVCAVAICTPEGDIYTAEGECRGRIAFEPHGSNGFGYDPVFYISGLHMTMAEAEPEIKNRISHRAMALAAIRPVLADLIVKRSANDQSSSSND